MKELTLTEIRPGPRFRWGTGLTSGADRWVVKNGKFETPGAAYYEADKAPAISKGEFPNREETLRWSSRTTHILIGKNVLKGVTFDSDPQYPLTFGLLAEKGYVHLCGRGTATTKNGEAYRLGFAETVEMWLPLLHSDDPLRAEAATQALGYLGTSPELKDKVVPELIAVAKSKQFGVSWNACEALGRIGDARALAVLEELEAKGGYIGRLTDESIKRIEDKNH